jgi:hypothetical protein
MSFVILTRNPRTRQLIAITGEDEIAEFKTEEEAAEAAANTTICKAWGYDVIEVPTSTD